MPGKLIRRLAVLHAALAAVLLCPWAAQAADPGFACPPAPAGWSLDAIPPTRSAPDANSARQIEWRAGCLYTEDKATIQLGPGWSEGAVADAEVNWTVHPGFCPLPVLNFGSFGSDIKSVDGDFTSDSKRAVATYSYEPVLDPFHGGMKPLAQQLMAAAEVRAADCDGATGGGAPARDSSSTNDGVTTDELEIASGLILLLLGGGSLVLPAAAGAGAGSQLTSNGGSGQDSTDNHTPSPPVVTITSPGQGDEVAEFVTVSGTVTGAISVFLTSPGGGAVGAVAGGAFSVSTRVGVQHAAIVVEAVNADGTGRAAVHVFCPGAPEWLPGDEEAHTQALVAQKQAAQDAEIARFRAAVTAPREPAPSLPAAVAPQSYDELIGTLTRPSGGEVGIAAADAPKLLPPNAAWVSQLISNVSIDDQVVTVQTPLGSGAGTLWANDQGRIVFDPTTILSHQQMVSSDLSDRIQKQLDHLSDRIARSGLRVAEVRVEAGRIWVRTVPR